MTKPDSEGDFRALLVEQPASRSLRLEFRDWLVARGDSWGDALTLWEKGELSADERRTLQGISRKNINRWLGPLTRVKTGDCEFEGGLLSHAHLEGLLPEEWVPLVGEQRFATVTSLCLGAEQQPPPAEFLAHPVLRGVKRLECGLAALFDAGRPRRVSFTPAWLGLHIQSLAQELQRVSQLPMLASLQHLALAIHEHLQAPEAALAILAVPAVAAIPEVEVFSLYGTLPFQASLLAAAAVQLRKSGSEIGTFSLRYRGAMLSVSAPTFQTLFVDLKPRSAWAVLHWAGGARSENFSDRVASIGSLLEQLGAAAGLKRVEIQTPPGGRFTVDDFNVFRLAVRRVSGIDLVVGGVTQQP